MCNSKAVNGELCTCTNGGTGKRVHNKSAREKGVGQAGKMYGERQRNIYVSYTYLCVCVYTTQNKQARHLVKPEQVLVTPKSKQSEADGSSFGGGELCREQWEQ